MQGKKWTEIQSAICILDQIRSIVVKCRLDFQKSSWIHLSIYLSTTYYFLFTWSLPQYLMGIWQGQAAKQTFKLVVTIKMLSKLPCLSFSQSQNKRKSRKHDTCTCSVTHDECSFVAMNRTTHHRPRHCSSTSSGEGHFVNNWKKCACYSLLQIHITCLDSHYQFCSSPQRIIHLEQLSVTLAVLQSHGDALGEYCGPASV